MAFVRRVGSQGADPERPKVSRARVAISAAGRLSPAIDALTHMARSGAGQKIKVPPVGAAARAQSRDFGRTGQILLHLICSQTRLRRGFPGQSSLAEKLLLKTTGRASGLLREIQAVVYLPICRLRHLVRRTHLDVYIVERRRLAGGARIRDSSEPAEVLPVFLQPRSRSFQTQIEEDLNVLDR